MPTNAHPSGDSVEAQIADARAQREMIDDMLSDLARGRAVTEPKQRRIEARNRQNGYGQNLELIYTPRGAVA